MKPPPPPPPARALDGEGQADGDGEKMFVVWCPFTAASCGVRHAACVGMSHMRMLGTPKRGEVPKPTPAGRRGQPGAVPGRAGRVAFLPPGGGAYFVQASWSNDSTREPD